MTTQTAKPTGWPDYTELSPVEFEINRWLEHLDMASQNFDAVWGIGRLPMLVSAATRDKWSRQWQKLNAAIAALDIDQVADLVNGTIRAYAVLDAEAAAAGHPRLDPDAWEYRHVESGRVYRICRALSHARIPAAKDTITITLEEAVNLWESRHAIYGKKINGPGLVQKPEPFDFKKGDDLPPEF